MTIVPDGNEVTVSGAHRAEVSADDAAPVRVLFIGGWGRSGSTLVERLLAEMPDVVGAGEVTHLWLRALANNQPCACGAAFDACPFWISVGKAAFDGWDNVDADEVLALARRVDRTRYIPRLALPTRVTRRREDLLRYGELYRRIYAGIAEVTGARVIVDSSKHASLAFALRHHANIDLNVLHLVRDGRGVAYSWSKALPYGPPNGAQTDDDYLPRYSIAMSSALWTTHNALFDLLAATGARRLRLRYERFVADPAGHLATVRAWLGLPPERADFIRQEGNVTVAELGPIHSVAGNPMRFQSGSVRLRVDSAWRTAMPAGRRRLVTFLTWPGRVRHGYLDRPSRSRI
jgi:hypothetical protein